MPSSSRTTAQTQAMGLAAQPVDNAGQAITTIPAALFTGHLDGAVQLTVGPRGDLRTLEIGFFQYG